MRVFQIIIFAMGLFSGWLRAEGYRENLSGTLFPDRLGALTRGKEETLQAAPGEMSVAIPYNGPNEAITVYVRHLPTDGGLTADAALDDALRAIKKMESLGKYTDVKFYEFEQDKMRAGWKAGSFTAKVQGGFVASFIYCSMRPGILLKVRATTYGATFQGLASDVESLLDLLDNDQRKAVTKIVPLALRVESIRTNSLIRNRSCCVGLSSLNFQKRS